MHEAKLLAPAAEGHPGGGKESLDGSSAGAAGASHFGERPAMGGVCNQHPGDTQSSWIGGEGKLERRDVDCFQAIEKDIEQVVLRLDPAL